MLGTPETSVFLSVVLLTALLAPLVWLVGVDHTPSHSLRRASDTGRVVIITSKMLDNYHHYYLQYHHYMYLTSSSLSGSYSS